MSRAGCWPGKHKRLHCSGPPPSSPMIPFILPSILLSLLGGRGLARAGRGQGAGGKPTADSAGRRNAVLGRLVREEQSGALAAGRSITQL